MEIPLRHATLGGQIEVYNGGRNALHTGERGFRFGCSGKAIYLDEHAYVYVKNEKAKSQWLWIRISAPRRESRAPAAHNTTPPAWFFTRFCKRKRVSQLSILRVTAQHKPRFPFFSSSIGQRPRRPLALFYTRNFYFQVKQDIKNRSRGGVQLRAAARALQHYLKRWAPSWKKRVHIVMWTRGLRRWRSSKSVRDWSCKYRIWSGFSGASQVRAATPLVSYMLPPWKTLFSTETWFTFL